MGPGFYGAKQAAARTSASVERVILGSDDDFDDLDDDSISGDADDGEETGVNEEEISSHQAEAAGEEFQKMMEQSPGALEGLSPGLQLTDFTGDVSLDGYMEAKAAERSRTTMERLSANSYQSRGAYSSTRMVPLLHDSDEQHETADQSTGGQPVNPEATSRSARSTQRKSSQRSTSQFEDGLPSSREIFAVGSKENQLRSSEGSFRTQSTVPFTIPDQSSNLPMVVVPPAEMMSSSGLASDIDDISRYLQQDIAKATTLQQEPSGDLPSTDPVTLPEVVNVDAADLKSEKEQKGRADVSASSSRSRNGKNKKIHADEDDGFETDDPEIGAPKEMYKPRPSRSRGKRTADDLDLHMSPKRSSHSEKDSRKVKRRKTDGDPPDSFSEVERPNKRQRKAEKGHKVEDGEMAETIEVHGNNSEPEDVAKPVEEERQIPAPAKKKRGRPKRSGQKAEQREEPETQDMSEREQDEMPVTKQNSGKQKSRSSRAGRQKGQVVALEDSEDELAGHYPTNASSDQNEDVASAENANQEEAKGTAERVELPPRKPAKRGRKSKGAQAKTEEQTKEQGTVDNEGPPEQIHQTDESEYHGQDEESNKTSTARVPLQERPDAANVDLTHEANTARTSPQPHTEKTTEPSQLTKGTMLAGQSPLPAGKTPHRIGLSKRMRIQPLLKVIKRK